MADPATFAPGSLMAYVTDWSTIARLERIGIKPGESFSWDASPPAIRHALTEAAAGGLKSMHAKAPTLARVGNGWQMNTDTLGIRKLLPEARHCCQGRPGSQPARGCDLPA